MKVRELIEELSAANNQDAEVCLYDQYRCERFSILFVDNDLYPQWTVDINFDQGEK